MGTARLKELLKTRVGPFVAARQPSRADLDLARWGLSVGSNGRLWSGEVDLADLARGEGTPLHVVRVDRLDRNVRAALEGRNGDAADIFYSYKTNPVPAVLRRLHDRGIGAEVISPYELWLAFRLGVDPERIIYNGPAKSPASLRTAIERGVALINANSASETELIIGLAEEMERTVRLGIRVQLPGMWGGQFGIADASGRVAAVVDRSRRARHVELRGLHVHRGLTMRSAGTFEAYVQDVLACCDRLAAETGWWPELLDLGGSLATPTVAPHPARQRRLNRALGTDLLPPDPSDCIELAEASATAAGLVRSHFEARGVAPARVVLEPGRALTSDAQFLLATVLDVKDDTDLAHAVLDTGINVAEPVPNEYHQLFSVTAPTVRDLVPYRLAGPICTPADVLYQHWRLPRLEPGHVLVIMDSGAYFVPFSTAFSFPRPAIVLQEGARVLRVRRREEFTDMAAYDDLPPLP